MNTPALFVGHGSPMNVILPDNPFNQGLKEITQTFEKPKLILCISAHWYTSGLYIASGEQPEMIYDFYGFPEELSRVVYPAKGCPEFAERLQQLLAPEQATLDPTRGFDHGAWAVLKHLYPEADIPVVQMSIDRTKPAQWHYDLAKKLRPLRKQGVLILASGDIVHNLRWEKADEIGVGYDWAFAFQQHINRAILNNDEDSLINWQQAGQSAALSVPTPDHYLPLLYVMAQYEEGDHAHIFNDELVGGSISMTSVLLSAQKTTGK